jgi:hypothetical protein
MAMTINPPNYPHPLKNLQKPSMMLLFMISMPTVKPKMLMVMPLMHVSPPSNDTLILVVGIAHNHLVCHPSPANMHRALVPILPINALSAALHIPSHNAGMSKVYLKVLNQPSTTLRNSAKHKKVHGVIVNAIIMFYYHDPL